MSRTKHHQKYGKNYSSKKYFVVPVGVSWWNHKESFIYINDRCTTPKAKKKFFKYSVWYKQTPSWWIKEFMTVPKRSKCRDWEKGLLKLQDIEECSICPDLGNRPHLYYW